ncbi:MAG: hypothetical protein WA210_10705 [Burkholderiaceae bacterium]
MNRMHLSYLLLMQRLRRPSAAAQRRFLMMNLADLDPMPLGPGWFDSSWELENGAEVCENNGLDAQLQSWFDAALRERGAQTREHNLVEFEAADMAAWQLPAQRSHSPQSAELELVPV